MVSVSKLKRGNVINYKDNFYIVLERSMHWTARWAGLITIKLKEIKSQNILTETFRDKEKFNIEKLEKVKSSYLYSDNETLFFLIDETAEIIELRKENFKDILNFLIEDNSYLLQQLDWNYIDILLPITMEGTIKETSDPNCGVYQSKKKIILDNNISITWPNYLKVGEKILYNTNTLEFSSKI